MRITKLGHCCLLIEEQGLNILIDPGSYSTRQNEVKGVDVILITHEHQDHFHLESLRIVLANNPEARIITNRAVGALLEKEGIAHELLEDKQSKTISGILLEGFGEKHATIYQEFGQVQNTGYFIANRLFYPGDAFYLHTNLPRQIGVGVSNSWRPVEILALPVAGPWMKISDAIDYAKLLKPRIAFPVHDGMLNKFGAVSHFLPQKFLPPEGIAFEIIASGETREF